MTIVIKVIMMIFIVSGMQSILYHQGGSPWSVHRNEQLQGDNGEIGRVCGQETKPDESVDVEPSTAGCDEPIQIKPWCPAETARVRRACHERSHHTWVCSRPLTESIWQTIVRATTKYLTWKSVMKSGTKYKRVVRAFEKNYDCKAISGLRDLLFSAF